MELNRYSIAWTGETWNAYQVEKASSRIPRDLRVALSFGETGIVQGTSCLGSSAEPSGEASMIVTRGSLLGAGATWFMAYSSSSSCAVVYCFGTPVPQQQPHKHVYSWVHEGHT